MLKLAGLLHATNKCKTKACYYNTSEYVEHKKVIFIQESQVMVCCKINLHSYKKIIRFSSSPQCKNTKRAMEIPKIRRYPYLRAIVKC